MLFSKEINDWQYCDPPAILKITKFTLCVKSNQNTNHICSSQQNKLKSYYLTQLISATHNIHVNFVYLDYVLLYYSIYKIMFDLNTHRHYFIPLVFYLEFPISRFYAFYFIFIIFCCYSMHAFVYNIKLGSI